MSEKLKVTASLRAFYRIRAFEKAAIERSWMGSRPPSEHRDIIERHVKTLRSLAEYIGKLEDKNANK